MKESCSLSLVLPITDIVFLPDRDTFCLKEQLPNSLQETSMVLREAVPEWLQVQQEGSWWSTLMTLECVWKWHVIGPLCRKWWLRIKHNSCRLQLIPIFSILSWVSISPLGVKRYFPEFIQRLAVCSPKHLGQEHGRPYQIYKEDHEKQKKNNGLSRVSPPRAMAVLTIQSSHQGLKLGLLASQSSQMLYCSFV